VVNEMIFVTDMAELVAGSPTRLARYAACAPPATTAVQVSALFVPGALIEIQATVELPGG
jgi:enamine deaminase RidA (YjgF/YER057c/UK114 family)